MNPNITKAISILCILLGLQFGYGQIKITDSAKLRLESSLKLDTMDITQSSRMIYNNSIMFRTDLLSIHQQSLGIFCKAEDKISAKAPVQLRFRLGGLDYVNRLEGK